MVAVDPALKSFSFSALSNILQPHNFVPEILARSLTKPENRTSIVSHMIRQAEARSAYNEDDFEDHDFSAFEEKRFGI